MSAPKLAGELRSVSPARLHPNPWNPNRMDERQLQAERESIATYGFVDPVTVRKHPDKPRHFQIIDGEHRWKVALQDKISPVPIFDLGDVSDVTAKKLTVVLNETRGDADNVLLGTLLAELSTEDDFAKGLAFSPGELKHLIELGGTDWDDFEPPGKPVSFQADDRFKLEARLPKGDEQIWHEAMAAAGVADADDEPTAAGLVIVALCKSYLRSKRRKTPAKTQ